MYKLFLELDDLLDAAREYGVELHLQRMQRTLPDAVPIPHEETAIYVTGRVPGPGSGGAPDLLAGRIVLERTEVWPPNQEAAIRASSGARAHQALALLHAAAAKAGVAVADQAGIVAEPGLLEDLGRVRTAQRLWHYRAPNRDDPPSWQLVAASVE